MTKIPLSAQFFTISCSFRGKNGHSNRLATPPLGLAHPSLGNPGSATGHDFGQWYHRFYLHYDSVSNYLKELKKK